MDFIVDQYFPIVDDFEERLEEARGGDLRRHVRPQHDDRIYELKRSWYR
jgi:hypothetical protein